MYRHFEAAEEIVARMDGARGAGADFEVPAQVDENGGFSEFDMIAETPDGKRWVCTVVVRVRGEEN